MKMTSRIAEFKRGLRAGQSCCSKQAHLRSQCCIEIEISTVLKRCFPILLVVVIPVRFWSYLKVREKCKI